MQHGDPDASIFMDVCEEGAWISVVVTNQGTPIPNDDLQSIFDPLVQLGRAAGPAIQTKRSISIGLGLFIARQIVAAHGGTIDVTSSVVEGTAFRVCLPKAISVRR